VGWRANLRSLQRHDSVAQRPAFKVILSDWVTSGSAERMAAEKARHEVAAALVPICIQQSSQDPKAAETLARLEAANRYQRDQLLMETGWATMPGSNDPNRSVASACMEQLARQF